MGDAVRADLHAEGVQLTHRVPVHPPVGVLFGGQAGAPGPAGQVVEEPLAVVAREVLYAVLTRLR
jgi:hypothetical protein